ncbi:MAG: YfhO family protein [Elusimicrobiota bacterium]
MKKKIIQHAVFGILFLIAFLLVWHRVVFQGLIPVDGTTITLSYPDWRILRASLFEGHKLPLWNTFKNMGEPFLANPATLAAYPVMWLLLPIKSYHLFIGTWAFVHSLIAAIFGFLLAKFIFKDKYAALAAAFVFAFNGFFVARITIPNHFAAAAYLPAVAYFQLRKSAAGFAISTFLAWTAGFPPFFLLVMFAVMIVSLFQGKDGIKAYLLGSLLAFCLGAFQIIPFIELMVNSIRGIFVNSEIAVHYSIPLIQLLKELVIPLWVYFSPSISGDPAIVTYYTGLTVFAVAVYSALRGRVLERYLMLFFAVTLMLSLGSNIYIYKFIPFLRVFRFPANWLMLSAGLAALLFASGVFLVKNVKIKVAIVIISLLELVVFSFFTKSAWMTPAFLSDMPSLAGTIKSNTRIYHTDLLLSKWEQARLKTEDDFMLMKDYLVPSYGTVFGIREVNSYQVLETRLSRKIKERLFLEGPGSGIIDLAAISKIITISDVKNELNRNNIKVLSRSTAVYPVTFAGKGKNSVHLLEYGNGYAKVEVISKSPGLVVLSEIAYPGWKLVVNGKAIAGKIHESAFIAGDVPQGKSTVEFTYFPLSFIAGMIISFFAFLFTLFMLIYGRIPLSGKRLRVT